MSNIDVKQITPIERLRIFVKWARGRGLCKSENDFERQCTLNNKYIANNYSTSKGNLSTATLARITRTFPQLNLAWLCTGEGDMIMRTLEKNTDYKAMYEAAMQQIEALSRIINSIAHSLQNEPKND